MVRIFISAALFGVGLCLLTDVLADFLEVSQENKNILYVMTSVVVYGSYLMPRYEEYNRDKEEEIRRKIDAKKNIKD